MPTGSTLPGGWTTMTGTDLPVSDYTVGSFTFRVRRQPSATRAIATLGVDYERFTLSFIVADITDYTTTPDTSMLISALRSLVTGGTSMIPAPNTLVTYGAVVPSYVESVEIAQMSDNTPDVFLVTCQVKEQPASAQTISSTSEPKLSKSDDVPPWQMPTDVTFEAHTTEGLCLGFAYPTTDLDGTKEYSASALLASGLPSSAKAVAVQNYADDPFSSPPSFPKANGTLRLSKGYLRNLGHVDISALNGIVNSNDIQVNVNGALLRFPAGTLSPVGITLSPKLYKMPIPWLPKTKHPLSKTYGELFYGYSAAMANKIAVNKTDQILTVSNPVYYVEMSASFSYRPEGFGVWLANRGYTEKDTSAADGCASIVDVKTGTIKEAWLDRNGKKTATGRLWRGFTNMVSSDETEGLLRQFFDEIEEDTFSWATPGDNFGESLL